MMKDIITMVTASIGCLLGIYNFIYGIVKKRTKIKFYINYAYKNYKILDSKEIFDEEYDCVVREDSIVCFSIKNESYKPIFFQNCSLTYLPEKIYIGYTYIKNGWFFHKNRTERTFLYFKYEEGKEIPIMLPLKIDPWDVGVIIYKEIYTRTYFQHNKSTLIPQSENEEKNFYYIIDNKLRNDYLCFKIKKDISI